VSGSVDWNSSSPDSATPCPGTTGSARGISSANSQRVFDGSSVTW
jgi:hypothetical protein